jgi:hypothetical protein
MVVIPRAAAAALQPAGGYRVALAQPGATPVGKAAVESLAQDAQVTDYSTSFRDRQSLRGEERLREQPAQVRRGGQARAPAPAPAPRSNLIVSSSAEFASSFEIAASAPVSGGVGTAPATTVANGIESYEENVRVTRGKRPVKGETLNIKL